jgi:1,4-alpha-glucan branching enzyme
VRGLTIPKGKKYSKMVEPESKKMKSKRKSIRKKKEKPVEKTVEFTFGAPDAKEVFLAGEFNNWDTLSLPMKKDKKGIWKIKIKLTPGRYEYKFFADNVWVESLPGAEKSSNPFGTQNLVTWVK